MKKKDIIVVLAVIVLMAGAFLYNGIKDSNKNHVEIYVGDKLYGKYSLDKEQTFEIKLDDDEVNIVHIHDGGVEMKEANCPDQVCVKTHFIKKTGQSIVCLPHKVNIKIVGDGDSLDVEAK